MPARAFVPPQSAALKIEIREPIQGLIGFTAFRPKICFRFTEFLLIVSASRLHKRGVAHRHECWARDAMDARARATSAAIADGEIVWSWRPWAGAKSARRIAGDGDYEVTDTGESTKISVNTIAQGTPVQRLNLW